MSAFDPKRTLASDDLTSSNQLVCFVTMPQPRGRSYDGPCITLAGPAISSASLAGATTRM
jgi:hypothetical protein